MAKKKLTPSITDAGADSPFGEVLVTHAREAWDRYYGVATPQATPSAEPAPAPAPPPAAAPAKKRPAPAPAAPAGFSLATPPGNTFDAFEAASRNASHPGRGGEALSYGEAQRKANAEVPAPVLGAKEEAPARPGDSRKVIAALEEELIRLKRGLPKARTLKDDYAGSNAGQADVEADLRGVMDRGYNGK